MARRFIGLFALLAGAILLPFGCNGQPGAATGADAAIGAIATPLHGPCIDWSIAGGAVPAPTVLAPGRSGPWAIAADGTNVYWTENGGVMSVPQGGGAPAVLAQASSSHAIAVDAENVYWADSSGVMRVPIDGGAPMTLFSGPTDAQGLAVDATRVYWTDLTAGTVMSVPRAGGAATVLASGVRNAMGIAVDGAQAVWAIGQPGAIEMVPVTGGSATKLASDQDSPQQVAIDALNVYWTNNGAGTTLGSVLEAPLMGGPTITLATGQIDAVGLAVASVQGAGTYVYWVDGAAGTLMATPAIGGFQPMQLASGLGRPERIAVGPDSLYWTDNSSGNVMQLPCARGALDLGDDAGEQEDGDTGATDASIDATVDDSPADASDGSESDSAPLDCDFDAASPVCNTLLPSCPGIAPVSQVTSSVPNPSTWTGGTIVAGQYALAGYAIDEASASCVPPLASISSTVEFAPTDATSGTFQIATTTVSAGSPSVVSSETATDSYTTSGSAISETMSCPTQGAPLVGSYSVVGSQLAIGDSVTFGAADGGSCTAYVVRIYDRLPASDAGVGTDAGVTNDAAATGATSDAGATGVTSDAAATGVPDDAGIGVPNDAGAGDDAGAIRDGGPRMRNRDGGPPRDGG